MKVIYVGVPKEHIDEADAVLAALRGVPGAKVKAISVPHLAIMDLAYQTNNPPDDLVRFWIAEIVRFDRNHWVGRFMAFVRSATANVQDPFAIIMLAGCDDDPILCQMMDVVYSGGLSDVVNSVKLEISKRSGG